VTGTFLYLTGRSLKNRLRVRLQRLRQPRYLAGLVVGLVYLYWVVVRNQIRSSGPAMDGLARLEPYARDIVAGGAVLLWCLVVLAWLWPFGSEPWTFTRAEVQFFFTAPVTRRQLLNYKLLRSQLGVLFGVFVASIFSGAARAAASGRWSFVIGGWLLFATLQLHLRGAGLTKSSFSAPASRVPVHAWVSAAIVASLSALLLGVLGYTVRAAGGFTVTAWAGAVLQAARGGGLASVALWPFAALVRPIFATSPSAFASALPPALAVAAVNYWWVLQSDASLEQAAIAAERRRADKHGPPQPVVRPAPFTLGPAGRPEVAVLWKNTILLGRYLSLAVVVRVLIPIVVLASVIGLRSKGSALAPLLMMLVVVTTVVGPYLVRNDLRHDMPRLQVLKTWPVTGRELVLGELLAPTVVLSALAWFLLAVALALAPPWRYGPSDVIGRAAVALGAAVLAPVLIAGQVLIQNAAVVLFPGWIPTGGSRPRGVEAMGQNMLMLAATLLALALGVAPALALAGGLGFLLYQVVGWFAVLPSAVLLAFALAGETALVVTWLGRVLDRTDPGQVEAAE
jgi:ABC-2 type transport system permease protein